MRISHEQAKILETEGLWSSSASAGDDATGSISSSSNNDAPTDFEAAMSKLKRSVSEKGKELSRVWGWNDEYGEIKRIK